MRNSNKVLVAFAVHPLHGLQSAIVILRMI